ncbi:MAG: hypothetical protein O3C65_01240 [Proteobacteria bacterium]|nr:hypothetical protein [Pseudomonadota bacterium]MDA1057283.1 hypothetical protein [Pseudomonadota bacterium]
MDEGGRRGVVYDQSPEAAAFDRWQHEQFELVEREFANVWREALETHDLNEIARSLRKFGIDGKSFESLGAIAAEAERLLDPNDRTFGPLSFAVNAMGVPRNYHSRISERWKGLGKPSLKAFSPYAAFVSKVELFFQIALGASQISSDRPSNRLDIAYLYYLPFCHLFVSSDRLHQRCATHFLRENQKFVWGQELKADLARLQSHFLSLPEATRDEGIMRFAPRPPTSGDFLTSKLWDHIFGADYWRDEEVVSPESMNPAQSKKLVDQLIKFSEAPAAPSQSLAGEPDAISVARHVRKKRGSWWQLPKDFEPDQK